MRIAYFDVPIPWRELVRRTIKETLDDDGLGLAAQMAYYFFLALVPALLFLLALASFFPVSQFTDVIPSLLGRFAAPEMVQIVQDQIQEISNAGHGGILSLGLLGALWSSSAALVSIIGAMNRVYDIEESRPWWKVRLVAIGLTIGMAVFVLASITLVLAGPALVDYATQSGRLGPAMGVVWTIVQWPLAFALASLGIGLVYYFAPDADQDWVWVTPGGVVATALWLAASLLFRFYVVSFGDYQATYGALGGVMVLLLWLYMTGLAIIVGGELSAEIEHASPWGKAEGEKAPGARRKLGAAAARAFKDVRGSQQTPASQSGSHKDAPGPTHAPAPRPVPAPAVSAPVMAFSPRRSPSAVDWLAAFALRLIWPRVRSGR